MKEIIDQYFQNQEHYENEFYLPVDQNKFQEIEQILDFKLPEDYKEFLKVTNGFEGFVGENYCKLNKLEDLVELTDGYCKEFFPWAVQIGSNGGGEMFVLDKREGNLVYGILPAIGSAEDFIPLDSGFEEFIKRLYYNDFWK